MKKTFCDICGGETKEKQVYTNSDFFVINHECNLIIEIKAPKKIQICKYCIINGVMQHDDRGSLPNVGARLAW